MTVTAKNYAAQVAKALSAAEKFIKYPGVEEDIQICKQTAKNINNAVHFTLPDYGHILDDDLKGLHGEVMRLPYKAITVEYFVPESIVDERQPLQSPKRFAFVSELEKKKCLPAFKFIANINPSAKKYIDTFEKLDSEIFISVFVCCSDETGKIWVPSCVGALIPADGWQHNPQAPTFKAMPLVILPGMLDSLTSQGAKIEDIFLDIGAEVRAVAELCEALSCSNVEQTVIQAEQKSTNIRRVKKGKLPIWETRALTITAPSATAHRKDGTIIGERNGPRQHLRRGHIRKLPSGKKVWVNSCVVGAHGRIDKDYIVKAA